MRVPRLEAQSLNRWLEQIRRPSAVSLAVCALALLAAACGCQSQQTSAGDPFLPFMRTRVPPPGTNVPADSYYQGAPATTAPPATMAPPAAAPSAVQPNQPDKYAPPGGYLPQSSIDRSKVVDPASGERKANSTAIARRTLMRPTRGQSTVDTELTAAKVTGGAAAAGVASTMAAGSESMPATNSVAVATSNNARAADVPAEGESEPRDAATNPAAQVAFADAPQEAERERVESENVDQHEAALEVAEAGQPDHSSSADARPFAGLGTTEQNPAASASTLRIVAADEPHDSDEATSGEEAVVHTTLVAKADSESAGEIADEPEQPAVDRPSAGSIAWNTPAQASPIETTSPADHAATLAMVDPASAVVPAGWSDAAGAASGVGRRSAVAGAPQTYGYDPSYAWVRGRLEYSASQRQWKLRYIPIDGATDQFGGSVVLVDGAATQNLQAGQFVTVQGRVVGTSQAGRGFSPRYEVASVEPMAASN
ncbi:MAG TPA: hypothetical protein VMF30_18335 [Pirellulales bacterium]|nr:hypothetical protein [Pirellulales bacterium]